MGSLSFLSVTTPVMLNCWHQGIRAALCWMPEIAHLSRQHNDANVLVMPGRFIDHEMAEKILDEFFNSGFEGGRHQKRIEKIPVK